MVNESNYEFRLESEIVDYRTAYVSRYINLRVSLNVCSQLRGSNGHGRVYTR